MMHQSFHEDTVFIFGLIKPIQFSLLVTIQNGTISFSSSPTLHFQGGKLGTVSNFPPMLLLDLAGAALRWRAEEPLLSFLFGD
jgi:hypothetical protein